MKTKKDSKNEIKSIQKTHLDGTNPKQDSIKPEPTADLNPWDIHMYYEGAALLSSKTFQNA